MSGSNGGMNMAVFWGVQQSSLVQVCRRLGGACCDAAPT